MRLSPRFIMNWSRISGTRSTQARAGRSPVATTTNSITAAAGMKASSSERFTEIGRIPAGKFRLRSIPAFVTMIRAELWTDFCVRPNRNRPMMSHAG
jgi:hypothetical protein